MPKAIVANGIPPQQVLRPTDTPKLAAIYARVSTTDQADKGYSLPTQIDACKRLAEQEGFAVPERHLFVDDYTGTSLNRPQLGMLRDLVRQRVAQAVIVYDLDRLSRTLAHQLLLTDEFEKAGAALRIVTMPHADKTPESQLLTNVRGIIAEYERAKILERTARGRRGRAQAGHVPGGRRTFGYVYVKHASKGAHYEVDPEEAALVERIFRLYAEGGHSLLTLAALLTCEGVKTPKDRFRTLGVRVWHSSTLANMLRNTAYIGTLYDGKTQRAPGLKDPDKKTRSLRQPREEWIAIAVPPIVDPQLFAAAQAQLVQNKAHAKRNRKHAYLLVGGRLRCGQCGGAMGGETCVGRPPRYRCVRGHKGYLDCLAPHVKRRVTARAIEPVVWDAVERVLNNPALIAAELERRREGTSLQQEDLDRERTHYERQLAQCAKDLGRWEAAYLGEAIDLADFKAKKAEVDVRRASAERELARLDAQGRVLDQAELETTAIAAYCARVRAKLTHFTLDEKRLALEALGITVTWHPGEPLKVRGSIPVEIVSNAA
jgi:site-specific DNA recombinase